MFAAFKDFLQNAADTLEEEAKKFTDDKALDRATAMCALVAYADGNCDSDEKQKTLQALQRRMPHFDAADVRDKFLGNAEALEFDPGLGEGELLDKIAKAKDGEGDFLIRCGVAIGGADGDFDDNEKAKVKAACNRLGLDPANYGL